MAAGMGIVMCNTILNTNEYAIDALNCFKVEYEIDAFVSAIEKYISKPDLIVQHGLKSKKLVYQRSIEGTALFYKDILEKIYYEHINSLSQLVLKLFSTNIFTFPYKSLTSKGSK